MSTTTNSPKTVAFYTLGCKLNYSETSTIGRQFEERGFRKVDFAEGADIYVINTCSVTENADKKCRKVVKEAKKLKADSFVAIVGCYAQLKPQEIVNIPGVDAVLGAAEKFRLLDHLQEFVKTERPQIFHSAVTAANTFSASYSMGDRTRTFLKVQDGCDYSCSFCTIPQARGASRSDTVASVVLQAYQIAQTDVKEVVLTGVNIGDFGLQNGIRSERFYDLVLALDQVEGLERFRISSIEPNLLSDEIIEFVAQSQRFAPHFHIPLQSGNNKTLAAMRRRYKRELYAERVSLIKQLMPDCCIGVDVIVGFPGESHEDFLVTYQFINELPISYLHVFTYSERANTHAVTDAKMLGAKVPMAVRAERSEMLHILSDKKRRTFYESQLGTVHKVLFEADAENGIMHGFTENYVKVSAKYDPLLVNEVRSVRLVAINEAGLVEVEDAQEEVLVH